MRVEVEPFCGDMSKRHFRSAFVYFHVPIVTLVYVHVILIPGLNCLLHEGVQRGIYVYHIYVYIIYNQAIKKTYRMRIY